MVATYYEKKQTRPSPSRTSILIYFKDRLMWAGIIYASGTLLTNAFLSALQTNDGDAGLEDFKRKYEAFKYFAGRRSDNVERYREYLTNAFDSPLGDTNPYPMPDNYSDIYGPKVALEMARSSLLGYEKGYDENLKQMMIEKAGNNLLDHVFKRLLWQQMFEFWEFAAQRYDYTPTFNVGDAAMILHDFKSVMLDSIADNKKITSTKDNKSNMHELNNLLNIVLKEIGESDLNFDYVNDALEKFGESELDLHGYNDEVHRGSEENVDVDKSKYSFLCKLQKWWENIQASEKASLLNIRSSPNSGQQEYVNHVRAIFNHTLNHIYQNVNTGMNKFTGDVIVQRKVFECITLFVEYDKLNSALIIFENDSEQNDLPSQDITMIHTKEKTAKALHNAFGEIIEFVIANGNPTNQPTSFEGFDTEELKSKMNAVYKRVDEIVQRTDQ